jgi:hypothetical protein
MDIVDSIMTAGAATAEVAAYIQSHNHCEVSVNDEDRNVING